MGKKIFIALLFFILPFSMFSLKWHDDLVGYLLTDKAIDKNMVVERNEHNNKINKASYKFVISPNYQKAVDFIKYTLLEHANEAKKFSLEDDKILLQVLERPGTIYSYRFDRDPKNKNQYVLLISVE